MTELAFESATELARLIRDRRVSPVEVTNAYLERIDKLDDTLNAFVTVAGDEALESARRAEQATMSSDGLPPFHGVPLPIKDLAETAGIRTTFSTKALADYVPDRDTHSVRKLRNAGFILIGKTNTPEFGTLPMTESELNGVCRNPWDPDCTPGGSSGGAAAAVAAGLAPIAHGSDGGGSIRIPSSCCGLFGIKPTRGRVSLGPRVGEGIAGLSTDGPVARSVQDAAAFLDVLEGYETGDPYWAPPPERPFADEVGESPGRLRIAVTTQCQTGAPVDDGCSAAVKDVAGLLASLGHDVDEANPGWFDDDSTSMWVKVWQSLTSFYPIDEDEMEPLNRAFRQAADKTSSTDYVRAVTGMHALARRVVAFWDDYDLVLSPTLNLPPVPVGWVFEEEDPWAQFIRLGLWVGFTAVINVTGQPAVSLPLYWSDEGLPIGVQLVGRPADESTLIRVSAQLEEARPWADRRPPIS
jgi:amidase